MGDRDSYRRKIYYTTRKQAERMGIVSDSSNETRIVIGGYERITYEEVVNGVKVIRTRWRKKRVKEKHKRN